jgi:3-dehydroquinate synthase
LLSQVDSSVGGKTGVNLVSGKNLVGCFYQPRLVLSDTSTLLTLSPREWQTGMAEIIKYGVIWSHSLFETLESSEPDREAMIAECCHIKAAIVNQDEQETYLRMILNFGHTVGHAIESVTQYTQYTHGEAVALGMIAAGYISMVLGIFSEKEQERLIQVIKKHHLPTTFPRLDPEAMINAMRRDKKAREGEITFVLPRQIGVVEIRENISLDVVRKTLTTLME